MKEIPGIVQEGRQEVEVRRATAGDIESLLIVEQQCFNVYYYAFYTFDRRDFEYYLDDPDCVSLVATLDAELVGYVLGPVETWREPPGAHIDSIAVLPQMQHQGIGGRLLQSFMRQVRQHGCEIITLEVSPANAVGMAFFRRYGFRKVHRLRNYYGKGLHGLLMAATSSPPEQGHELR